MALVSKVSFNLNPASCDCSFDLFGSFSILSPRLVQNYTNIKNCPRGPVRTNDAVHSVWYFHNRNDRYNLWRVVSIRPRRSLDIVEIELKTILVIIAREIVTMLKSSFHLIASMTDEQNQGVKLRIDQLRYMKSLLFSECDEIRIPLYHPLSHSS